MSMKSRLAPFLGFIVFLFFGFVGGLFATWLIGLVGEVGLSVSLITLAVMYLALIKITQKKPDLTNLIYFTLMGLGTMAVALMLCDILGLIHAVIQTCFWLGLFFVVLMCLKPKQVKPF